MSEPFDLQINQHFAVVSSLGSTVIIETFRSAVYYITHSNDRSKSHNFTVDIKEGKSCFVFIQGTGLEILINRFGLDYNADNLRQTFNYCVRKSI